MVSGGEARVAVLVPCYNEEQTVAQVVREFRAQLPAADIYVFDNKSTDRTVEEAKRAGAIVRHEARGGKGFVIRSMFKEVDADVYVMVDGDGTYPADKVQELIRPVVDGTAEMTIGSRLHTGSQSEFKILNRFGNRMFRFLINTVFRVDITDLLSGYRAFSRGLVKSLPFMSHGFESETELTVKCLVRGYRILEIPINLVPRPAGSYSKIRILQDGLLILHTMVALVRDYKPLTAFGLIGLILILLGLIPGGIVLREFLLTHRILHFPSAILAVGLVLSGLLMGFTGMVLHAIARHFQEVDHQLQTILEHQFTVLDRDRQNRAHEKDR